MGAATGFLARLYGRGRVAYCCCWRIFRSHQILVHGVNKSDEDLAAAVEQAGVIVVDNPTELARLAALRSAKDVPLPELWLRVRPGVAVDTHAYRQTGQHDSKFGFSTDEAIAAVGMAQSARLARNGLPLSPRFTIL